MNNNILNSIFRYRYLFILLFLFYPYQVTATVITDWRQNTIANSYPKVVAYDFNINTDTACSSRFKEHIEPQKHTIFLPSSNPGNVSHVLLYFHGNRPTASNLTPYSDAEFCYGTSETDRSANSNGLSACHAVTDHPETAILVLRRPTQGEWDGSRGKDGNDWLDDFDQADVNCLLNSANEAIAEARIPTSASLIYGGFSAGGNAIQNIIPFIPPSSIALYDACYGRWCEKIIGSPNAREVFFYYRIASGSGERDRAREAINREPAKSAGFILDKSHGAIPGLCTFDMLLGPNDEGKHCLGFATRDAGDATGAGTIAGIGNRGSRTLDIRSSLLTNFRLGAPNPQIKIPGLTFTPLSNEAIIQQGHYGERILSIPFLGEYIVAVFRFSMGVLSIFASIAIIIGGLMYMTSGASNDTAKAKQIITNAVVALVLASTSYVILNTINPELLRIRNLEITLIEPIHLEDESFDPVDSTERGRGQLPANFTPPTGPVADSQNYSNSELNPIPELLDAPQPPFPACTREAAQWTAKALDALNICVGPCHCGYTASHFLNYIGCTIDYSGGANNLTGNARSTEWTQYNNMDSLPPDAIGLLSKEGDTGRIVHVGVYLGEDLTSGSNVLLQFDSGSGGGRSGPYGQRVGNMCPSSRWFWDLIPNDPQNNCYGCSRIPARAPVTGRSAAAFFNLPGQEGERSLVQGTNQGNTCKGIQIWLMQEYSHRAWTYLYVPSNFNPNP